MWFMRPVPMFAGAAAVLIALSVFGRRLVPRTYVSRRAFWCPFRRANVRVEFRKAMWDPRPLDVNACSAFSPPLECDKPCLLLREFPAVKAEVAPPRRW
jgi:hypothetical protein